MSVDALREQVAGILVRENLALTPLDEGRAYGLQAGSALFFIEFGESGDKTFVRISSPLVKDIDLGGQAYWKALESVNELNSKHIFATFYLDRERATLRVEHDLFGGDLQASELMAALNHLAVLADGNDDRLAAELGGKVAGTAATAPPAHE